MPLDPFYGSKSVIDTIDNTMIVFGAGFGQQRPYERTSFRRQMPQALPPTQMTDTFEDCGLSDQAGAGPMALSRIVLQRSPNAREDLTAEHVELVVPALILEAQVEHQVFHTGVV